MFFRLYLPSVTVTRCCCSGLNQLIFL